MILAPSEAGSEASLGTTAKSSSALAEKGSKATRALRYQAQSEARHILRSDARKAFPDKYAGDVYRTADCRYVNHGDIGVRLSPQYFSAHYAGLVTCGSVWACPVCASRIQERRRLEIEQAISWADSEGLTCVLVTLTFPHRAWHRLADLIAQQRQAFTLLRKTRAYRSIKPVALIRSLEVTHGSNGWHPHTHELWFCEQGSVPSHSRLTELWQASCVKTGLLDAADDAQVAAFAIHAVDIKRDMTSGDYLAKQDDSRSWGFSHEVSKATSKSGRKKGVHPHHFLVRKAPRDSEHFLEYVQAMKGARQLFWSPGFKARVGLEDLDDVTVADESRESADLLALLTPEQWALVRGNDARAELLDVAESQGLPGIESFLNSIS